MFRRSNRAVNDRDYEALFSALNHATEILHRNRTPDPAYVAAYDTLRQTRAMLEKALVRGAADAAPAFRDLAAA